MRFATRISPPERMVIVVEGEGSADSTRRASSTGSLYSPVKRDARASAVSLSPADPSASSHRNCYAPQLSVGLSSVARRPAVPAFLASLARLAPSPSALARLRLARLAQSPL